MKLIIAGTRSFNNYELLKSKLDFFLQNVNEEVFIISGKAPGADSLGETYAIEKGFVVLPFPAKWKDLTTTPCKIKYNKHGEAYNALAGFNRNEEMAKNATHCVCFWDGISPGTSDMIQLARKYNLKLKIVKYETN